LDYSAYAYAALAVFLAGLLVRAWGWFSSKTGPVAGQVSAPRRVLAFLRGIAGVAGSPKLLRLFTAFFADVVFHRRLFAESRLRWAAHLAMYFGFVFLLLFHAMGTWFTVPLAGVDYARTSPWLFLRDAAGFLVLAGAAAAVLRRFPGPAEPKAPGAAFKDAVALCAVFVILFSGVVLAGAKIVSRQAFDLMAMDYAGVYPGDEEYDALLSFWVKDFGMKSPGVSPPFDPDALASGEELSAVSCEGCHSAPVKSGFLSFAVSRAMAPAAAFSEAAKLPFVLFWVHVLASLAALAAVPWTMLFHVLAAPLSVLANAVMDEKSLPANVSTRQALEMDACLSCAICSAHCSMAPAAAWYQNPNILPADKLAALKKLSRGKALSGGEQARLLEGVAVCTECSRCTVNCPAGINLKDLWECFLAKLADEAPPEAALAGPLGFLAVAGRGGGKPRDADLLSRHARRLSSALFPERPPVDPDMPLEIVPDRGFRESMADSPLSGTFSKCFTCEMCTNACPAVAEAADVEEELGLAPAQVIRCVALGRSVEARTAPMLHKCLTCYRCQEVCPSGVRVTDILGGLKNQAAAAVRRGSTGRAPASPADTEAAA